MPFIVWVTECDPVDEELGVRDSVLVLVTDGVFVNECDGVADPL